MALPGTVFALLANNHLVAIRVRDGGLVAERVLAAPPAITPSPAHLLALSVDGRLLFVLTPGPPEHLVVVDVATVTVRATYPLPADGTEFRSLAVGPVTGRLYLFGNRAAPDAPAPTPGPPRFGQPATGVVVAALDPERGMVLATWRAREPEGHDWRVYQGAVSDDERQLFISYHGADTTGIDRFEITGDGLRRCPGSAGSGRGCIDAHGSFVTDGDRLLAATGSNVILEMDWNGTVRRGLDTGLPDTHLMEFAFDRRAGRVYAAGSCLYRPGFSAADLGGGGIPATPTVPGEWAWLATPAPPHLWPGAFCGERLALGPAPLLVVGPAIPGDLLLVDTRDGQTLRSVPTPAAPIDILVAALP